MRAWVLATLLITATLAGCVDEPAQGGLDRETQLQGWDVTVTYPNGTTLTYHTTADPSKADTSGNGLTDFQEFQLATDPQLLDTDEDGLLDGPNQCVEEESERYETFQQAGIIEHTEEPGCFLGEQPLQYLTIDEYTDPTDAFTSDNSNIGNGLNDGEEVQGWDVQVLGQEPYASYSNPAFPDTSGNGLHDGVEKRLGTDPQLEDTDGDGTDDQLDAAPLGNLVLTFHLDEINLKESQTLEPDGGADLILQMFIRGEEITLGPIDLEQGENSLELEHPIDVDDKASGFDDEGAGAGIWEDNVLIAFWHQEKEGEPIDVKEGANGHVLELSYNAFDDAWTGDAQDGETRGPDADVTLSLTSTVEPIG